MPAGAPVVRPHIVLGGRSISGGMAGGGLRILLVAPVAAPSYPASRRAL